MLQTNPRLNRLMTLAGDLGPDELTVLLIITERLRGGRAHYGELHVATDSRCFSIEALEEVADALVYAAAALIHQGVVDGAAGSEAV